MWPSQKQVDQPSDAIIYQLVLCKSFNCSSYNGKTLNELADAITELDINELFYRTERDDTLSTIKRCQLGILRRIITSQINVYRVTGLSGKEKSDYYKIPEDKWLTARNLLSIKIKKDFLLA